MEVHGALFLAYNESSAFLWKFREVGEVNVETEGKRMCLW